MRKNSYKFEPLFFLLGLVSINDTCLEFNGSFSLLYEIFRCKESNNTWSTIMNIILFSFRLTVLMELIYYCDSSRWYSNIKVFRLNFHTRIKMAVFRSFDAKKKWTLICLKTTADYWKIESERYLDVYIFIFIG